MSHGSKYGMERPAQVGRMLAGAGLAGVLAWSVPGVAQVTSQRVTAQQAQAPTPGTRFEAPPGAVVDDPNRVFGDEGPDFQPLAIVGALGLRPYASLATQYDSNVARVQDGEPVPARFRSKSDWNFRPTAGVALERPVGRQRLFMNASVGRIIYARNTRLNSNRLSVGGGLGFTLGRTCGGQVSAAYSTRDTLIGGFEDAADARSDATTLNGTISCATATGLVGGAGYSRGTRTNTSNDPNIDRSFADSNFQSVNGNIGYRVGQRGTVGVSAAWSENVFPNQLVLGQENSNTIRTYSLYAAYRIGNSLNANASIGQSEVSSNAPGGSGFSGGTWSLGVGYSGPRLGGNLSVGRSVNGGGGIQAANFSINESILASVTYRLNDAMRLSAGATRSTQDFEGTLLVPETQTLEQMRVDRVFVGASYRMRRLLTISADFNHQRRLSVPAGFGFNSTGATLNIGARF